MATVADPRSAGPFESVLRAICLDVPGLHVTPQVRIGAARVDLADEGLRLVIEADSYEWHGGPVALERDCRRYDELVADGWVVLRFPYAAVFDDPAWVADILARTTTRIRAQGRTEPRNEHETPWPLAG